jgi:methyl-accepting chemotaxis protein
VIGVYRWIPERQLALLTEMHRSEATAPARRLSAVLGVIGVIAVGLLAAGAYFIARRIAEPILAVSETAVKIADGDLTQLAPVQTDDEVGVLAANFNVMTDRLRSTLGHLEAERERSDSLLLNVLPPSIADRLKDGEEPIVDSFSEVSVLFADIVDFTGHASRMSPVDMMSMLNRLFSAFDELSEGYGVEKIKTVGDSYLVVGGLPMLSVDSPSNVPITPKRSPMSPSTCRRSLPE